MLIRALAAQSGIGAFDYQCDARSGEPPFTELHAAYSISYVRKGSFACATRGQSFDLVPGALMLGRPGQEFACSHDHHEGGDECLSFRFSEELAETFAGCSQRWQLGCLPPLPELMILGELAQSVANGDCDLALDEVASLLATRLFALVSGRSPAAGTPAAGTCSASDRRRALDAALFIAANPEQNVSLEQLAGRARLTPFHFLRLFTRVAGVSPHQYRIRCRLRKAATLLSAGGLPVSAVAFDAGFADLSNFVRTFHRAAGVSPLRFRQLARADRKILQARLRSRP